MEMWKKCATGNIEAVRRRPAHSYLQQNKTKTATNIKTTTTAATVTTTTKTTITTTTTMCKKCKNKMSRCELPSELGGM